MQQLYIRQYRRSVYAVFTQNRVVYKFATGIKVDPEFFNKRAGCLRPHCPGYDQLNAVIDKMRVRIGKLLYQLPPNATRETVDYLYSKIEAEEQRELRVQTLSIAEEYNDYRSEKSTFVSKNRARRYKSVYRMLLHWQGWLGYEPKTLEFDKRLYGKLIDYLLNTRNLNDNTTASYVWAFHGFLTHMYPDNNWAFCRYKAYIPTVVYLLEPELKLLLEAELTGMRKKARDLFVFCATSGMRYGDTQTFSPGCIVDGVIQYEQAKTRKIVSPPLCAYSTAILQEWGGVPPTLCLQKYNTYIKIVCRELGMNRLISQTRWAGGEAKRTTKKLWEVVSTHTARKTFIMTCLNHKVPLKDIMDMSGHSDLRAMKPYMDIAVNRLKETVSIWNNL